MGIWVHPYALRPAVQKVRGEFRFFKEWLRLQQASEWIPHPIWMCANCCGGTFAFIGIDLDPSPSDIGVVCTPMWDTM